VFLTDIYSQKMHWVIDEPVLVLQVSILFWFSESYKVFQAILFFNSLSLTNNLTLILSYEVVETTNGMLFVHSLGLTQYELGVVT
jgi:hypothetical protein